MLPPPLSNITTPTPDLDSDGPLRGGDNTLLGSTPLGSTPLGTTPTGTTTNPLLPPPLSHTTTPNRDFDTESP